MISRCECPECGGLDTERVDTTWREDEVEETRICNSCPTQYTVEFGNPVVSTDFHGDWSNLVDAESDGEAM